MCVTCAGFINPNNFLLFEFFDDAEIADQLEYVALL
jgi:hypothetical protein